MGGREIERKGGKERGGESGAGRTGGLELALVAESAHSNGRSTFLLPAVM